MQGYKEENAGIFKCKDIRKRMQGIFKCKDIRKRMQVYLNARI